MTTPIKLADKKSNQPRQQQPSKKPQPIHLLLVPKKKFNINFDFVRS